MRILVELNERDIIGGKSYVKRRERLRRWMLMFMGEGSFYVPEGRSEDVIQKRLCHNLFQSLFPCKSVLCEDVCAWTLIAKAHTIQSAAQSCAHMHVAACCIFQHALRMNAREVFVFPERG